MIFESIVIEFNSLWSEQHDLEFLSSSPRCLKDRFFGMLFTNHGSWNALKDSGGQKEGMSESATVSNLSDSRTSSRTKQSSRDVQSGPRRSGQRAGSPL